MKYLLFITCLIFLACKGTKTVRPIEEKMLPKEYYVHLSIQNYGNVVILLHKEEAPNNAANIVALTKKGFYNGLKFHRIIAGFVIQGGCPNGDGTGDPGYEIDDEISPNLKHKKGTVAMANHGPNTNGSQFYICLAPQPRLDGGYTIIGDVVEGMDVVEKIGAVKTTGPPLDRPLVDVIMDKVWIEER